MVLDAKTGAYQKHFQLVKRDFHDWDISGAPVLFLNKVGHRMMAEAPKDGHLYLIDLNDGRMVYRKPVTTVENVDALMTAQGTRFCPGSQGGAEWNGAAFDPSDNLIFTGEVDWCTTVHAAPAASLASSNVAPTLTDTHLSLVPPGTPRIPGGYQESLAARLPKQCTPRNGSACPACSGC